MKKQNMINHVALVLDDSGSMNWLKRKVIEVFDKQVAELRSESRKTGQETRLSVFTFGQRVDCIIFDRDIFKVEGIERDYTAAQGHTALIDGTLRAIEDLKKIPTLKDDHAFLIYVITDGLENYSANKPHHLEATFRNLNNDWTYAALVPNTESARQARSYGFPDDNIRVWETTEKGLQAASETIVAASANYYASRTMGIKSTKTLFEFKPSIAKKEVEKKLEEVDPGTYETLLVRKYDDGKEIKEFVETWRKLPYRVGSAYYQLSKPEKIQGSKTLAVLQKSTGKLYSGQDARKFLGLPDTEVKVKPADYANFDIFVQSTSTNRHLVADTQLIVFK